MTFDSTINLGTILQIVAFVLLAYGGFYAIRNQVSTLARRMRSVEDEIKKFGDVLVQLARQDERLNSLDRRIDELTHSSSLLSEAVSARAVVNADAVRARAIVASDAIPAAHAVEDRQ